MYSSANAKMLTINIVFDLLLVAVALGHTTVLTGDARESAAILSYVFGVVLVSAVAAPHRTAVGVDFGGDHAAV